MLFDENGNPIEDAAATVSEDDIEELFSGMKEETPSAEGGEGKGNEEEVQDDPKTEKKPEGGEPAEGDGGPEVEDEGGTAPEGGEISPPAEGGDEISALKAQIESLTALVDKLSGPKEDAPAAPAAKVEAPSPAPVAGLEELFKELDFDKVMESKEGFVEFLTTVITATKTQAKEEAKQEMLTSIPNVVGSFVQRQASLQEVATEFYSKYPELKRVKRYVATVANEVSAEHPEWNIAQVLEEAATRSKTTLNIQTVAEDKEKKAGAKPSLPGGGKGARTPVKPSGGLQDEITDLISD